MNDEQIKQNAEEYILPLKGLPDADENITFIAAIREAFVAGAHSRDEEVEMLQNQIEELSEQLKMNAENIQKLRNPWISVNVKLPEVKKRVLFLCNNGMAYFGYNNIDNGSATITNAPDGVKVTHWMPIPELKKGE